MLINFYLSLGCSALVLLTIEAIRKQLTVLLTRKGFKKQKTIDISFSIFKKI